MEWTNDKADEWVISINEDGSLSIRKNGDLIKHIT